MMIPILLLLRHHSVSFENLIQSHTNESPPSDSLDRNLTNWQPSLKQFLKKWNLPVKRSKVATATSISHLYPPVSMTIWMWSTSSYNTTPTMGTSPTTSVADNLSVAYTVVPTLPHNPQWPTQSGKPSSHPNHWCWCCMIVPNPGVMCGTSRDITLSHRLSHRDILPYTVELPV